MVPPVKHIWWKKIGTPPGVNEYRKLLAVISVFYALITGVNGSTESLIVYMYAKLVNEKAIFPFLC